MSVPVTCSCGRSYRVKDEYAGKRVKCPACGQTVQIPERQQGDPLATSPPPEDQANPEALELHVKRVGFIGSPVPYVLRVHGEHLSAERQAEDGLQEEFSLPRAGARGRIHCPALAPHMIVILSPSGKKFRFSHGADAAFLDAKRRLQVWMAGGGIVPAGTLAEQGATAEDNEAGRTVAGCALWAALNIVSGALWVAVAVAHEQWVLALLVAGLTLLILAAFVGLLGHRLWAAIVMSVLEGAGIAWVIILVLQSGSDLTGAGWAFVVGWLVFNLAALGMYVGLARYLHRHKRTRPVPRWGVIAVIALFAVLIGFILYGELARQANKLGKYGGGPRGDIQVVPKSAR
jgi:hypothetical protein